MTLEDFFTLTEMKNGLSTSARVEELISMMQKQVDIVTSNTGDAARQWSIVAGTLAATDNKDCLHHFVQLNGVILLNRWLQEAIKCSDEAGDSSVEEELVNALLGSLERLPIDNEKSIVSGINITVEHLLCHKTCNFQERAKILLDQWNCARVDDARCQITDTGDAPSADDATKGSVMHQTSPEGSSSCKPKFEDTALGIVSPDNEHGSKCSNTTQLENAGTLEVPISHVSSPGADLIAIDANAVSSDRMSSYHLSTSCMNNLARTGESSVCPAISMASTSAFNNIDGGRKVDESNSQLDDGVNDEKQIEVAVNAKGDKEGSHLENCNISSSDLSQRKPLKESDDNFDAKESSSCLPKDAVSQVSEIGDDESLKYTINFNDCQEKENEDYSLDCQGLSSKATINRVIDFIETNCQLKEAFSSKDDTVKVDGSSNLKVNGVDLKAVEAKLRGVTVRPSDLELECGEIDAVDVAQQDARKVEHEVSNYREPSSRSPEISSGKIEANTFDSLESKEGQPPTKEQEVNGQAIGNNVSERPSSPMEDGLKVSEDLVFDPKKEDMASLKSISIDKKPAGEVAVCRVDFDLNADVADEENDCSMYPSNKSSVILSAPKAVVASSKGTSGLPVPRLQFEGEMGWRGSAATSAFRPTSSQKTPDSSSGSKQKPAFLGIDLNITSEDGEAANTTSVKQLPHSGFPSADSSIEVSSRRSEKLNLDLNRLGDEEVSPYSSLNWRPLHKIADRSMSPSSSSSSRVPSTRDFDLNDNPSLLGVVSSQNLNRSSLNTPGTYYSSKTEDPCITIMGSRMTVERKSYADQPSPSHQAFLGGGVNIGTNMATRTMMPYHMPATAYGYNGIGMETAMPIPSALYGLHSTPYLVDSSGVKVIPQLLKTSEQNTSTSGAFHLGVGSDRAGWNMLQSSEPALDLNFGMTSMESASRQPGSLKQFFGFLEEQATTSQPESSGMSLKRKEPDSGWDSHPFAYKQVKSSWL
ncbi:Transcription factor IIS N-terminal protein [Dioscorea alata]|uniref:Transcription factor IIS N-terminal protein n=1 Tax=Dioscorea alata TaxID=55571 RepID=A0ACB7TYY9_DIOAL|nr:Transcription factor IIS N-terminal protein [Dioscorea alata]